MQANTKSPNTIRKTTTQGSELDSFRYSDFPQPLISDSIIIATPKLQQNKHNRKDLSDLRKVVNNSISTEKKNIFLKVRMPQADEESKTASISSIR